jgi:hypothetical protein
MSLDDSDLFCRIYIDHQGPSEVILGLVAHLLSTSVTPDGSVRTDSLDVAVDHGDSWPIIEARDHSDWINWKYSLEVVPTLKTGGAEAFAEPLKGLLAGLSDSGVKAVPSCKYEELLAPWNLVNA